MKSYILGISMFSLMVLPSFSAFAEDDIAVVAEKNKTKVEAEIKKETPVTQWIDAENAVLDNLSKEGQQIFYILRNKYSVMRSVEIVKRDVGNAVQACSENNKDMADTMKERFKAWTDSVDPILKGAKEFLDIELKEQEAFDVKDYKRVVDLNDKAFAFSESQVKKTPVTTAKACQSLLESMDRTEEKLINILQDVLLPEEVVRERVEQINKTKSKTNVNTKSKAE